jgi:hypothetical protein
VIGAARWLVGRVADVLHARSDADHRARGWQVRRGEWGGRRYRLDVASWLDAQLDRAGAALTGVEASAIAKPWRPVDRRGVA